jgi:hypothetical protein
MGATSALLCATLLLARKIAFERQPHWRRQIRGWRQALVRLADSIGRDRFTPTSRPKDHLLAGTDRTAALAAMIRSGDARMTITNPRIGPRCAQPLKGGPGASSASPVASSSSKSFRIAPVITLTALKSRYCMSRRAGIQELSSVAELWFLWRNYIGRSLIGANVPWQILPAP